MKWVLIIGGTGMLRNATDFFIINNYHVLVCGRNLQKLNYFTQKHSAEKKIDILSQDYCDTANFIKAIESYINKNQAFDIIICWMHSNANDTLLKLIDLTTKQNNKTIFYHIKGSAYYNKKYDLQFNIESNKNKIDYREIFLGYKIELNQSRWLTNDEISLGVIEAVTSGNSKFIVGQIDSETS